MAKPSALSRERTRSRNSGVISKSRFGAKSCALIGPNPMKHQDRAKPARIGRGEPVQARQPEQGEPRGDH